MLIKGSDFARYTHKGERAAKVRCWICDRTFEVSTQESEVECPCCSRLWTVLWDTVGLSPHLVAYAGDAYKDAEGVSRLLAVIFNIEAYIETLKNSSVCAVGDPHGFQPVFSREPNPVVECMDMVITALKADLEATIGITDRMKSRKS